MKRSKLPPNGMTIPGVGGRGWEVGGEGYNNSNNPNLDKNTNLRPKHYALDNV